MLGFKTLPITYGKKASPPPEWTHTDSETLWADAPRRCNTALQAGYNNMFLLDPDTDVGQKHVESYLSALGINPWRIITWRGYTHFWLKTEVPTNTQWNGKLKDGMGDWRGKNGYGLAAPSYVRIGNQSGVYTLPGNNPLEVPFVQWSDILPLLQLGKSVNIDPELLTLPVQTVRRSVPRWAYDVVKIVNDMDAPGDIKLGHRSWYSRSEAVFSVIMSGLLSGRSFREVQHWFSDYRTESWWKASTAKAIAYMRDEAERPVLEEMYNSAFKLPLKDERVLRAMIAILWYVGDLEGCVANRDLQLLVARGRHSVSSSVSRLIKQGYVELVEESEGAKASKYRINPDVERSKRTETILDRVHHEAFRHGGIPASAVTVLQSLSQPRTVNELVQTTDLSQSAVYSALHTLKDLDLAVKSGKHWAKNGTTVDQLNSTLDTTTSHAKRKHRIIEERSRYYRNRGTA